ncbi:hypothetical protein ACFQ1S_41010, partial [Kibdelosporangium lantanae]
MAVWLATTGWMVACYLILGVVVFTVTAFQATWGGPIWWPVLVGLFAVVTSSAIGHALGLWFPSRFTAPLAAIGLFTLIALSMNAALGGATFGLLSPLYPSIGLSSAVFYPTRAHLAIIDIICYTGILAVALAATARDRRRLCATLLIIGLLSSATAVGLLASTPRNPWIRSMAVWLATTGWMVACYLILGVVVFTVTA